LSWTFTNCSKPLASTPPTTAVLPTTNMQVIFTWVFWPSGFSTEKDPRGFSPSGPLWALTLAPNPLVAVP
jgi:hypothetical protein